MDESIAIELRALQARAYGPDADLHRDPAALDRLRQLEGIARARAGGPGPETAAEGQSTSARERTTAALPARHDDSDLDLRVADSAASVDPAHPASVDPAHAAGEQPADAGRPPRGRWSTKRVAVVLIASVMTAVVVTAIVTGLVSRRVQADPREVAVLGIDPSATIPEMFRGWQCDGDDCAPGEEVQGTVFTDFHGLSAFTMPAQFMGPQGSSSCLMIMATAQLDTEGDSFSGPLYNGCGAGGFPATVVVPVTAELPAELRDEFPDGSGLQFVLDGSEVVVLSDRP